MQSIQSIIDNYEDKQSKEYEKACTLYCNQIATKPHKRQWEKTEKKIIELLLTANRG